MNEEYGKMIALALAAVQQMHADVSKLLVDANSTIGKEKDSVFDSTSICGSSQLYDKPTNWIPWCVYRYFASAEEVDPSVVEAITVWFFDNKGKIKEPHLLIGQICYSLSDGQQIRSVCHGWDLVWAYSKWSVQATPEVVLFGGCPLSKPSVRWFKVIAVPLFTITSMANVVAWMEQVRATKLPPSVQAAT